MQCSCAIVLTRPGQEQGISRSSSKSAPQTRGASARLMRCNVVHAKPKSPQRSSRTDPSHSRGDGRQGSGVKSLSRTAGVPSNDPAERTPPTGSQQPSRMSPGERQFCCTAADHGSCIPCMVVVVCSIHAVPRRPAQARAVRPRWNRALN